MAQKYFRHSVYQEGDSKRGLTGIAKKRNYVFSAKLFGRGRAFCGGGGGFVSFQLVLASNVWNLCLVRTLKNG